MHPLVKQEIITKITNNRIEGKLDYTFVEAALLLDDHYDIFCDEVWYIDAGEDIRRKRLKDNRGYSDEKINNIFASQKKRTISLINVIIVLITAAILKTHSAG